MFLSDSLDITPFLQRGVRRDKGLEGAYARSCWIAIIQEGCPYRDVSNITVRHVVSVLYAITLQETST